MRLFWRNIKLGIKSLLMHKLRSFLTMLGMVFGVGSVIAMLSVGEGASQDALEKIERLGTNNIILSSVKPSEDQSSGSASHRAASVYGLRYVDAERIEEQFQMVQRVVPVRRLPKRGRLGGRTMELNLVGTTPGWFDLVRRPMIAGRAFNWVDYNNNASVAVLTEHGARRLLATDHVIGQSINISGKSFTVVGIVQTADESAGSYQMPDRDTDAYIPLTTIRERFGELITHGSPGQFMRELVELHQIIVEVETQEQVRPTAAGISTMLQHFRGEKDDYAVAVPLELLRQAEETKRMFNIVLGSIAGISLLVGGIGIMNIMLASITERTREIGIRRAIGAKKRQIVAQFLTETVVLSAIGGILGVVMGLIVPLVITYFSQMPTVTPIYSIALSLGISAGIGVIFGLYPAVRAANLDPIVALRHE